jgi:hypothetical protein
MRVANYLDSRADCLLITNGQHSAFAALLPVLSVDPLDLITTPMNPYDTYLETQRGIFPRSTSSVADASGHCKIALRTSQLGGERPLEERRDRVV